MKEYPIGMIPGPTWVDRVIAQPYGADWGSPDMEPEFGELYRRCQDGLRELLSTRNDVAIQSGEGMLALWGALKSVLRPGERVLCVAGGYFGEGFAQMCRALGYEVLTTACSYNTVPDPDMVRDAAMGFRPKLITAVHCETPSGVLTPIENYGAIARDAGALLCVDFVSSAGGTAVPVDMWGIDLGLLGSQKCLGLPPDLCFTSVSPRAWDAIKDTDYKGYDALMPFREAPQTGAFPYTHNWRAVAALELALGKFFSEGPDKVYHRHSTVAHSCRHGLRELGMEIYPKSDHYASPTVTAAYVPEDWSWPDFDRALRERGLAVGGSYGPLDGKIFRVGHMGGQANPCDLNKAMDVIAEVLGKK